MKDLSAFAAPTLNLDMGRGRVVNIEPPSAEVGAKLSALITIGSAIAANEVGEGVKAAYSELVKGLDDTDSLNRMAVGDEYDRMIAEGWPSPDVETVCQYAIWYWAFGEAAADQILESRQSGAAGPPGKPRRRGRNGHRTA